MQLVGRAPAAHAAHVSLQALPGEGAVSVGGRIGVAVIANLKHAVSQLFLEKFPKNLENLPVALVHADIFSIELLDEHRQHRDQVSGGPGVSLLKADAVVRTEDALHSAIDLARGQGLFDDGDSIGFLEAHDNSSGTFAADTSIVRDSSSVFVRETSGTRYTRRHI